MTADPIRLDHNIRMGGYTVLRSKGEIRRRGKTLDISPKSIQVLDCLVEAGHNHVPQTDFIKRVWNDNYIVGEHGLRDAIWELRKAFNDDSRNPKFIQTIPRKGYRLLQKPRIVRPLRLHFKAALALSLVLVLTAAWFVFPIGDASTTKEPPRFDWSGPPPVVAGDRKRIAFMTEVNGQSDLFVVTGDFEDFARSLLVTRNVVPSAALQVTNSKATEISPVWAPNHLDLAFIEYDRNGEECLVKVYRADENRLVRLANDCYLVVSPIADVPAQLSWTPDGKQLAYQSRTGHDSSAISLVTIDGFGSAVRLTEPQGDIDAFPRWSNRGELAFVRLKDPMMALGELVVIDQQAMPILRCPAAPVWGLAWADDQYIAVTAALNNPFNLWLFDSATGNTTSTGQRARHLQSAKVGDALIVDKFALDSLPQQFSLENESPPISLDLNGSLFSLDYSSATGSKALLYYESGQKHLAVQTPDGKHRVVYSASEIYGPRFSFNGQKLAFSARNSIRENAVARAVDLKSGRVTDLSSGDEAVFFSEWAADGNSYYGLRGVPTPLGKGADLYRIDLNGVSLEKIANGATFKVVNDYSGAVWWSTDEGVIYRRLAETEAPAAIRKLNSVYESWTVDRASQVLYVSHTNSDGTEILALDNSGSAAPRVTKSLAGQLDPIVGLKLGPDQSLMYRRAVYTWRERLPISISQIVQSAQDSKRHWRQCTTTNDLVLDLGKSDQPVP